MKSDACMICRYDMNPQELSNLKRLYDKLSRDIKADLVHNYKKYNWHSNNKCKYSMSCNKTRQYENSFRRLTQELNILLSGYIEQTNCEDYHEVLRYLQGYFPSVYREFEINIRQKRKES